MHAGRNMLAGSTFAQDTLLIEHSNILLGHRRGGDSDHKDRKKEKSFKEFHSVRTLFAY